MRMHNPPHPGELLKSLWLEPLGINLTQTSKALGVSRKHLSSIINRHSSITPEMALRLEMAFGVSAESWLGHQMAYDLWQADQHRDDLHVQRLSAA